MSKTVFPIWFPWKTWPTGLNSAIPDQRGLTGRKTENLFELSTIHHSQVPVSTWDFSPHLCVGFLFLILYPASFASPASAICHTPSFTHNFVTHHLSHTIFVTHHLSHTIFHTQLCHTPSFTHHLHHLSHTNFVTHTIFHANFVTHHLSHTNFVTQLCHPPSFTPIFFHTHTPSFTHQLCHTPSFTHHLTHTTLSPTIFHTPTLSHTIFRTPPLSHTIFHTPSHSHNFVTQHLSHTTFCHNFVAGMALVGATLRGRRGTWRHPPSFCVLSHTHTHHLSHTISVTQLCHTASFTHQLCPQLLRQAWATWRRHFA